MNSEHPDVQAGFRNGRRTRDPIANIYWSLRKQESSRKTTTFTLLTMPKSFTVWIIIKRKILEEMEIQEHLTCLLGILYAGQ